MDLADGAPPQHGPELARALRAAGLVGAWNFAFGLFYLLGFGFGALCCALPAGAPPTFWAAWLLYFFASVCLFWAASLLLVRAPVWPNQRRAFWFAAAAALLMAVPPTVSVVWEIGRPRAHGVPESLTRPAVMFVLALLPFAPNLLLRLLHDRVLGMANAADRPA